MTFSKKIFLIFLFIYLPIGIFYSLETGLSHDEFHEQLNWEFNLALIKSTLFQIQLDPIYDNYLETFHGVFHGIGFHILSQPIQFLLENIISKYQTIDQHSAHLLGKHPVIFISFFISGIFVYLITRKIISNEKFCMFITALYLSYPYLVGHAFFNPKDIPFLCFWIICTYLSFDLFEKISKGEYVSFWRVILISFITAFLISIRITGVLIFIQYLVTFIIFLNSFEINFFNFIKKHNKQMIVFLLGLLFFIYLLYPVFWTNPLLLFTAINYLGHFFHDVCTLTLGTCMDARKLDPTYIPIWLSVKLPLLVLIGILLLPFSEKKIFINKKNNVFFGTILFTSLGIPIFLIINGVNIYDEIRHILFLIPIIFILGVVSFYVFSSKIFYFFSFATLFLFIIENIKIYPYQYVWFNTPSRVLNLSKNFELDYWGVSSKELAKKITEIKIEKNDKSCVLIGVWSTKSYLDANIFDCIGPWSAIDSNFQRPFFAIQNVRNLKKGRSFKCKSVYEEKFKFLFFDEELLVGRIVKCT